MLPPLPLLFEHLPAYTPRAVFGTALVLRLLLVLYSGWMDAVSEVKYTDVDYAVFSDAAREVASGGSPYDRATYRYTPLMAWLLLPNCWFPLWGKFLFCGLDLLIGVLTVRILALRGVSTRAAWVFAAAFLLHPMTLSVSTRGNGDSLVCAMVLLTLYCLLTRRDTFAAITYGLAVHLKIFPIIYVPAVWLFIDAAAAERRGTQKSHMHGADGGWADAIWRFMREFFTPRRLRFGFIAATTFSALTGGFYYLYGFRMLWETYLYHVVRADNRHNFSPYFYDSYLSMGVDDATAAPVLFSRGNNSSSGGGGSAILTAAYNTHGISFLSSVISELGGRILTALDALLRLFPQWGAVLISGGLLARDLPAALFVQTFAFVSLNKVITAQYFNWWICLLPLVLPQSRMGWRRGAAISALWLGCELLWLLPAFFLELRGQSVFLWVWVQGLIFLSANAVVLCTILRYHTRYDWASFSEAIGALHSVDPSASHEGGGRARSASRHHEHAQ